MKIELHKVTWYSKLFAVILFVGVFYLGFYLGMQNQSALDEYEKINAEINKSAAYVPFNQEIKQEKNENYTAEYPVFSGSDAIVSIGNTWVKNVLNDFALEANTDVPQMRADFGADSPTAKYNIVIKGTKEEHPKAQTLVLSIYTYTGGANGTENYYTITVDKSGKLLTLNDVIQAEKQDDFVKLVKETTSKYDFGDSGLSVFPEAVGVISMDSLNNWAMTKDGLKIYFSEYEVAPGAAGAISILIPEAQIKDYLR